MNFNIGDEVIMNEKASKYNHTKPGSTGRIIRVMEYEVEIDFNKITGAPYSRKPIVFTIDKETVDLFRPRVGHLKDEIRLAIKKLNNG